jgi:hypothetical protein
MLEKEFASGAKARYIVGDLTARLKVVAFPKLAHPDFFEQAKKQGRRFMYEARRPKDCEPQVLGPVTYRLLW